MRHGIACTLHPVTDQNASSEIARGIVHALIVQAPTSFGPLRRPPPSLHARRTRRRDPYRATLFVDVPLVANRLQRTVGKKTMCGIAGFLTQDGPLLAATSASALERAQTIAHRGPDDCSAWSDPDAEIAVGHRRLAILDLLPAGHQPMASASGRYVLAYNGEVYNHLALRVALEKAGSAPAWRGHSDTETLLACFEHCGVEQTLNRTVGMFAIALWDRKGRTLHLARDRFGEKPLYYGWGTRGFVFGSELKALRPANDRPFSVSRECLAQYLRFTYVPAPRTILENIFKLEPGCWLAVREQAPRTPPSTPLRPPAVYASVVVAPGSRGGRCGPQSQDPS